MATNSGTIGYALKAKIIGLLRAAYAANPDTVDVEVRYAAFGIPERERVHGGHVRSEQQYAAHAGGTSRYPREEHGTIEMHVMVAHATADVAETDARAQVLGAVLEDLIATDPQVRDLVGDPQQTATVPQLMWCGVQTVEGEYFGTDDGVGSLIDYVIGYRARL